MNPLSRLSLAFLQEQPGAAADVLETYPAESAARFLAAANRNSAEQVIAHFTPGFAADCLVAMESAAAGHLFGQLLPDFQVMILRQLDRARQEALLAALPAARAVTLRRLLPYPDGTAASAMEAAIASVPETLAVRHALKRIKRMRQGLKFYVYVINQLGQLRGVLTLHELMNASASSSVGQVMHTRVVSLAPGEPLASVINSPYWQDYHALPVIDENRTLLGVIRQKNLRRLQERVLQADGMATGLDTFMAVGALFSLSAAHLLEALIATGSSLAGHSDHD